MSEPEFGQLHFQAGQAFTPGSPINERQLFSGRIDQIAEIVNAISQKGYHAVLYGERGVGKTSLSNVLVDYVADKGVSFLMPRANCDASDSFSSLWKKALRDIIVSQSRQGLGFTSQQLQQSQSMVDGLSDVITPDDVRRALEMLSANAILVIIFDEFDRLQDKSVTTLMADTIKSLSDYSMHATILIIGVADSVDNLIAEHHSVERALVQVHLPRMSEAEVKEIIKKGLGRLGMTISKGALNEAAALSQGLPYVTQLLGLHSARQALGARSLEVLLLHVRDAMRQALAQWQQSSVATYYAATRSHQPGNIFKEVLAACAVVDPDEQGYFTAAAVRYPLNVIIERPIDIPNFARHLNEFTKSERGPVLERTGGTRRVRYRFVSPLVRAYATIRSVADGIVSMEALEKILSR